MSPAAVLLAIFMNAHFSGIGPHVGLDAFYNLSSNFGIVAHGSAAVYFGDTDLNSGFTTQTIGTGSPAILKQSLTQESSDVAPTLLSGSLGMYYTKMLNGYQWTLEVGYQAMKFFNVFSSGTALINYPSLSNKGVGFYGPYLRLSMKFPG